MIYLFVDPFHMAATAAELVQRTWASLARAMRRIRMLARSSRR
jgi:hypothetical protein